MDEKIVKDSQVLVKDLVNDTISRKAAIEALEKIDCSDGVGISLLKCDMVDDAVTAIKALPSAQPECDKEFVMLKVIDLNGRPYYSIIYLEDGREYEGYSSYDLMVISEYLKRYFGFAQPEIIHCKDCKWSDWYDAADGHRYCHCMETGASGRTADDFCSYAERKEA